MLKLALEILSRTGPFLPRLGVLIPPRRCYSFTYKISASFLFEKFSSERSSFSSQRPKLLCIIFPRPSPCSVMSILLFLYYSSAWISVSCNASVALFCSSIYFSTAANSFSFSFCPSLKAGVSSNCTAPSGNFISLAGIIGSQSSTFSASSIISDMGFYCISTSKISSALD
jgi:hypothetical protein